MADYEFPSLSQNTVGTTKFTIFLCKSFSSSTYGKTLCNTDIFNRSFETDHIPNETTSFIFPVEMYRDSQKLLTQMHKFVPLCTSHARSWQ